MLFVTMTRITVNDTKRYSSSYTQLCCMLDTCHNLLSCIINEKLLVSPLLLLIVTTGREEQEAQLNARGGRPYCPQSHKYNQAVRRGRRVSRQKIVIPSVIGLAAVLAVGHLS